MSKEYFYHASTIEKLDSGYSLGCSSLTLPYKICDDESHSDAIGKIKEGMDHAGVTVLSLSLLSINDTTDEEQS